MRKIPEKNFFLLFFLFFCLLSAGGAYSADSGPEGGSADRADAYYYFTLSELYLEKRNLPRALENLARAAEIDPGSSEIRYRLGVLYTVLNRRGDAVSSFTRSIALDPSNARAYRDLARFYLSHADETMKKRGREFLLKAVEINPEDPETYRLLCASELYSGNLEKAERYAEKILSISSNDLTAHLYLGSIAARRDDLDSAAARYRRALRIQPTYYPAFVGLVEVLEKAKRIEEAIEQYDLAVDAFPPSRDIFVSYGNLLYRQRRLPEAIEQYLSAEAADPGNHEIKFRTGIFYLETGSYEEAAAKLKQVIRRAPSHYRAVYYSAVAHTELGRYSGAKKLLGSIPETSPLRIDAAIHRAYIRELEGSASEACRSHDCRFHEITYIRELEGSTPEAGGMLEALYEKNPDDPKVVNSLGKLYSRRGRFEDSVSLCAGYLEKHPGDEMILYSLAVFHYYAGRVPEALAVMKDIIAKNPENFDAMNFLGYTYAERGEKLDYAEKLISRALDLAPGRGYIIDSMGWVHYQKGDYEKALEYLLRASKIPPADAVIFEHLGDAYGKLGESGLAEENYEKALGLLDSKKPFTAEDGKVRARVREKLKEFGRDEA